MRQIASHPPPRWLPLVWVVTLVGWGCAGADPSTPVPGTAHAPPETTPATPPGTSEVVGQVARPPGTAVPIVMLEPHDPFEPTRLGEPVEVDQYGRAFFPSLLVVPEGQVVRFRNSEDELHNVNVHSDAGETIFNVGMPILGGIYDHTFDQAGDYAVACNLHQEMAALIVVTRTPFATATDREGHFTFTGVPHGRYDFVVRRGGDREVRVVEVVGERVELGVTSSS